MVKKVCDNILVIVLYILCFIHRIHIYVKQKVTITCRPNMDVVCESSQPRPLKVIRYSKECAVSVPKGKHKQPFDLNIKIHSDLTYVQRESLSLLRKELDFRMQNREANIIIKYIKNTFRIVTSCCYIPPNSKLQMILC